MHTVFEKNSSYPIDETIKRVKSELMDKGFGVLWELNFKNKFKEKGFDYKYDYWIFEVCNPKIAIQVIETDQTAGYFLPCKVAVFDSDQGVRAGLVKPSEMIGLVSNDSTLQEHAKNVEDILTGAIDRAL